MIMWNDLRPKPRMPKEGQLCWVVVGKDDCRRVAIAMFDGTQFLDPESGFKIAFLTTHWAPIEAPRLPND